MDYRDPLPDEETSSLYWDDLVPRIPMGCVAVLATIAAGFFYFVYCMLAMHPDTPEQVEGVKEFEIYPLVCGAVAVALWGILITRGILGNGKEQAETLKSAAQVIIPSRPKVPTDNKDILVRASNQTSARSEELLRPAQDASEVVSNELLRASDSE